MRVLQVHTSYREPGGEDAVVAAEAALLTAAGHEVVAWRARNPDGAVASLRTLATAPWRPGAAAAARRAGAAADVDVAHIHNTWYAMSPAVVHALSDVVPGVVMTLHNYRLVCPAATMYHHGRRCNDCIDGGPWRAVAHRCYRDSASQSFIAAATVASWRRSGAVDSVGRFIALSDHGRSLFIRAGLPEHRIVVQPHPVEDPGRRPTAPSAAGSALFVGRAVPEKGIAELLAYWVKAPRSLALRVLGEGPALDGWRGRVPSGVALEGSVSADRVREAMRSARVLLVPSRWEEPFGLVAVEAMANGLPVLSSGLGALGGIHGTDAGWIASPGPGGDGFDANAWDTALWGPDGVIDDAACDARGAAGRRRYLDQFTPGRALRSLEKIYREAGEVGRC